MDNFFIRHYSGLRSKSSESRYDYIENFYDGMALVYDSYNRKYGYIDKSKNLTINFSHSNASNFSCGFALVWDGYYYYINKDNENVFQKKFKYAHSFSEELATVAVENWLYNWSYGFINNNGDMIIPPKYLESGSFHEGLAFVSDKKSRKYGYINQEGDEIIPFIFDEAGNFCNGYARVFNYNKYGYSYIEKYGNTVIDGPFYYASDFHEELAAVCDIKTHLWG